jgi:hypothetical protein
MSYKTSPYEQFLNWGLLDTKGSGQSRQKEYTIIAYNITGSYIFNEGYKIFNRKYPVRNYDKKILYENSQEALESEISQYFKAGSRWKSQINEGWLKNANKLFEETYHTEKAMQEFDDIIETLQRNPKTNILHYFTSPEFERGGINLITYSYKSHTHNYQILTQRFAVIFWTNPPPKPKKDKIPKDIEEDSGLPHISDKWYEYGYYYNRGDKEKWGPYYRN